MKKKKLSSYQKLKQKNRELLNDIYALISDKGSVKTCAIESRYKMQEEQYKCVMFAGRSGIEKMQKKMGGIIPQIKKSKKGR